MNPRIRVDPRDQSSEDIDAANKANIKRLGKQDKQKLVKSKHVSDFVKLLVL